MKFSEILDGKHLEESQIQEFVMMLDEDWESMEDLKVCFAFLLNDGHHSEFTAKHDIDGMEAVVYLNGNGDVMEAEDMADYLGRIGLTPEMALSMVHKAHEKARDRAAHKGIEAPELDCNLWDAYQSMAMVLSDYWYTVNGNLEVASMIAYEYLSDPDKPRRVY